PAEGRRPEEDDGRSAGAVSELAEGGTGREHATVHRNRDRDHQTPHVFTAWPGPRPVPAGRQQRRPHRHAIEVFSSAPRATTDLRRRRRQPLPTPRRVGRRRTRARPEPGPSRRTRRTPRGPRPQASRAGGWPPPWPATLAVPRHPNKPPMPRPPTRRRDTLPDGPTVPSSPAARERAMLRAGRCTTPLRNAPEARGRLPSPTRWRSRGPTTRGGRRPRRRRRRPNR